MGQIYANHNHSILRWNCLNGIFKKIKLNFNECDTRYEKRNGGAFHVFTEFIDESLAASNLLRRHGAHLQEKSRLRSWGPSHPVGSLLPGPCPSMALKAQLQVQVTG